MFSSKQADSLLFVSSRTLRTGQWDARGSEQKRSLGSIGCWPRFKRGTDTLVNKGLKLHRQTKTTPEILDVWEIVQCSSKGPIPRVLFYSVAFCTPYRSCITMQVTNLESCSFFKLSSSVRINPTIFVADICKWALFWLAALYCDSKWR